MEEITPPRLAQAFFIGAASAVVVVYTIPALRARFLTYGPRATVGQFTVDRKPLGQARDTKGASIDTLLDYLASWRVPHAYFLHFYIVSVLSSISWAYQLLVPGSSMKVWLENTSTKRGCSMTAQQILLTWSMMAFQGLRRLGESILFARPTTSKMSFLHWLVGIAFYLVMGVAVWSEGAGQLRRPLTLQAREKIFRGSSCISTPTARTRIL